MRSHNAQKKFNRPFTKHHTSINYYTNPSEDEEFTPLVRSRPPRRRKGTSSHGSNAGKRYVSIFFLLNIYLYNNFSGRKPYRTFMFIVTGMFCSLCLLWILIVIYASPLADVEVVGISNVLGTQKELIFNLQVRAR